MLLINVARVSLLKSLSLEYGSERFPRPYLSLSHLNCHFRSRITDFAMALNMDGTNEAKVGWVWGMGNRSTFDVLWTCLSVVLVCTYKVIHLNLSACREAEASWDQLLFWKKWLRKLKWMGFMALSPELLLAMALQDFEWSRRLEQTFARTGSNHELSLRGSTLEADAIHFVEDGKATSGQRSKSNTLPFRYDHNITKEVSS